MDHGNDIKSPSMHRSDVIEKRMEMLATLLDRINEEGMAQTNHQIIHDKKGGNKGRLMKMVAGIFFHRVK